MKEIIQSNGTKDDDSLEEENKRIVNFIKENSLNRAPLYMILESLQVHDLMCDHRRKIFIYRKKCPSVEQIYDIVLHVTGLDIVTYYEGVSKFGILHDFDLCRKGYLSNPSMHGRYWESVMVMEPINPPIDETELKLEAEKRSGDAIIQKIRQRHTKSLGKHIDFNKKHTKQG